MARGSGSNKDILRSKAFVARVVDYGEADRIVSLLTERFGKLSALARHARKSRKRFGAALSPYLMGDCELSGNPSERKLMTLRSYTVAESFPRIPRHVDRVSLAGYFTELCREITPDAHPEPEVFGLLLTAHRLLDRTAPTTAFVRAFEFKLLSLTGLAPRLDQCMGQRRGEACGRSIPVPVTADPSDPVYGFDPGRGGVLCPTCADPPPPPGAPGMTAREKPRPWVKLSEEALRAMQELSAMTLEKALEAAAELPDRLNRQIRSATEAKFAAILTRELKSVGFIKDLKRARAEQQKAGPVE